MTKVVKDTSYGVVPIIKKENEWQVLLVHQLSHKGGRHRFWIFPKGHAEGNENGEEAARRELQEETGISEVELEERKNFTIYYSFNHKGTKVEKTVIYFIGYCKREETVLTQPEEIIEIKWFNLKEAKEILSHQNSKQVLEEVNDFLKQDR